MFEINAAVVLRPADTYENVAETCNEGFIGYLKAEAELRKRASRRNKRRCEVPWKPSGKWYL